MLNKLFYKALFAATIMLLLFSGSFFYRQLYSQAERYLNKEIVQIDFKGNSFVKTDEMYKQLTFKLGDPLTNEALNQSIKKLMQSGSFKKVWVEAALADQGVALLFQVIEYPFVGKITMKGSGDIGDSEIRDSILLKEGKVYTKQKEAESIDILMKKYREKGLMNAYVTIQKSKIDAKKNTLDIQIRVDEGEKIKISKINILGTKKLQAKDIISRLELKENGLLRSGNFREDKFEQDKENIIKFYKEKGYLKATLEKARWDIRWKNPLKKDKRVIVVTFKVFEGEQYFFDGYFLEWDTEFFNKESDKPVVTEKKLMNYFEYTNNMVGKVFNNTIYQRDSNIINYLYSQKGYIFARVVPEQTYIPLTEEGLAKFADSEVQKRYGEQNIDYYNLKQLREIYDKHPEFRGREYVHTKFTIYEGIKGYLENIIIKGNNKTKDKVIRREVLLKEGDLFNAELVQRTREKIYNLGYFKTVNVDARPGSSEGKMNLIIEVEEQSTGTISLGGGYGTLSGFSIFAEVSEKNLKGSGQTLSGKVEFGPKSLVLEGSWTQPWLNNRPWSLSLSASYAHKQVASLPLINLKNTKESSYYYKDSIGFGIGFGHTFAVNWGHYHRIVPLFSKVSKPSSMVQDDIYQLVKEGWKFKHTLTNGIYFDNLDNVFNTTKGVHAEFSIDLVGSIMGGSSHYVRFNPVIDGFWWPMDFTFFNAIRNNILRRWRIVFEHRISAYFTQLTKPVYNKQDSVSSPYIDSDDKLYLGGYKGLRGWDPYDTDFPLAWQNGGAHRVTFSNELRIPLEPNLVWLVFFFDIGAIFDNPGDYPMDMLPSSLQQSIRDSRLNAKNFFDGRYYRYSWGFGIRVQIPILPIRLYMAQRLAWNESKGRLAPVGRADDLRFVFGIGDVRY